MLHFLVGRLSTVEEEQIGTHLEECHPCRRLADVLSDDIELRSLHDSARRKHTAGGVGQPPTDAVAGVSTVEMAQLVGESLRDSHPVPERPACERPGPEEAVAQGGGNEHPSRLGRFEILRRLGAGGFGVVYLAYDPILKRQVALKLPRPLVMVDAALQQRFLHEGQVAANMQHENIIQVLEAGEVDGVCYLASVYCPGPTLAGWIKREAGPASFTVAARIVQALAGAVSHAHEAGILHRDIKPGNVLLDESQPSEGLPFTPKLTDFGLSKSLHVDGDHTVSGVLFGTPRYMAPEQAAGRGSAIGAATDVYALGAVLYELLAGRPPIRGADNADTLCRVLQEEPVPIRRLAPLVPPELEAICAKCLQKQPHKRYPSAAVLAADLGRFLRGETPIARPDSPSRATLGWMKRHPARTGLICSLVALALVTIGGLRAHSSRLDDVNSQLTAAVQESRRAQARAQQSEMHAQQLRYAADLKVAFQAWRDGDLRTVSQLVGKHVPQAGQADLRGFEWWWLRDESRGDQVTHATCEGVNAFCFLDAGHKLATVGNAGLSVWDARAGRRKLLESNLARGSHIVRDAAGHWFAVSDARGSVSVWESRRHRRLLRWPADTVSQVEAICFLGDTPRLALIDAGRDERILMRRLDGTVWRHIPSRPYASCLAGFPDGRRLAFDSLNEVVVWDVQAQHEVFRLQGHRSAINAMVVSSDGATMATASEDGDVRLWNARTGRQFFRCAGHLGGVKCVAFSPQGRTLVSGDERGVIKMWHVASGQELCEFAVEEQPVRQVAFSPDGCSLGYLTSDSRLVVCCVTRVIEAGSRPQTD